ncbi:ATP-binding protein [Haemophilus haemolyticus]|uniref:ATP-binding protein n=1 Tax=Haemophilus haemolyticus TaxID=726 RepID=A0A502LIA1_HAEHA|nr:ATP-binding protein [Haemophilus haemolyticus]TPH23576.1 ATP-binding protein [Haemophilus haemolyticus]
MTNNAILKKSPVENSSADVILENATSALELGSYWLNKTYLPTLAQYPVLPPKSSIEPNINIRLFKLSRLVTENKQAVLESLAAIYTALGTRGCSVFLYLEGKNGKTDVYIGVKGKEGLAEVGGELITSAFNGHFTGSELTRENAINKLQPLSANFGLYRAVTSASCVPSISIEERDNFMQGLEHFIDAAENQNYQALILAEPVSNQELNAIEAKYANIATQLSPLLKQQISFGENSSESIGTSISRGITESFTQTTSNSKTISVGTAKTISKGSHIGGNTQIGFDIKFIKVGQGLNYGVNKNEANTVNEQNSSNVGNSDSHSNAKMEGSGENQSQTTGLSRTISLDSSNKSIERLLAKLDQNLERIDEAHNYGAWYTAAYFISSHSYVSESLASIFLGLMRGEKSNSEYFALNSWENKQAQPIFNSLSQLSHPVIDMAELGELSPATLVSGKEMAIQLGLPRRSTSTVTVIEAQTFGRQIQNVDGLTQKAEKSINLGVVRHLWTDLPQKVELDVKKLSSHIFVTGSTGSGKSNTVYQLLSELNKNDVNFMVIEPAKGEYKNVFGHRKDVTVLGTNPLQAELLKINPFKFPKGVHVLEHIDRLVEIFNVCWPMYAAMPAILKDAMLEAYKTSDWDLDTSCNLFGKALFPTFTDLLTQLEKVIHKSAFSEEVKSNYIGSLVTRVKSLTNGLNGQIFASNEIDNAQLFDSNVIVDLSRIGSQETKSLIMGILVMRLSEHRMSNADGMNQPLKHVTVLEEAHNILKRTSTEQSSEGANVAGKAVEMLSNAIAEMRTYGEGFIIADQSPSAVDISAIRNTNTKIIMRLPDETDRRLAGKAAGVTNEQLEEIAKLPKGVAVVYQNDWLEPVLCKIHHFSEEEKPYKYEPQNQLNDEKKAFHQHIADLLFSQKTKKQLDLVEISKSIEQSKLKLKQKKYFLQIINSLEKNYIQPILLKDDDYLIQFYQRIIYQQVENVQADLSIEVQQHLANIM